MNEDKSKHGLDFLTTIPIELKTEIFKYLCSHCTSNISDNDSTRPQPHDHESLAKLCLTCRSLRDVAQPILYHYFWCQKHGPDSTMNSFAWTLNERPHLAGIIRRVEFLHFDVLPDHESRQFSVLSALNAHQLAKSLSKIHFMLFDSVLAQAINLEELTVTAETWTLPAIDFPRLRFLRLNVRHLDIEQQLSGDNMRVRAAQQIERLWLNTVSEICEYLPNLAPNTQRLTLEIDFPEDAELEVEELVKGLPKLTTFELQAMEFGDFRQIDILSTLLARKDDLTRIGLYIPGILIDLSRLKGFSNLKHLRLAGKIQGSEDFEEYLFLLRLESLWIELDVDKPVWLVAQMSERVSRDDNLKSVKCSRLSDDIPELQDASWYQNVKTKFEAAGVEFEIVPNCDDREDYYMFD
ncbi:hypothetical protein EDB81DRAFT_900088 [Dactylonectria macrodidyma]|uniref:F-box domain-containing protein n=1 Tax=Dactylonectria macrodidyma TaxID=307937 RepID=A0A9P9EMS4_9HYPO|nr:hypothetical protein EDB81DRAFT_900088 [Dactylonectria macrodidyma]